MAKSQRKILELQICDIFTEGLKEQGYICCKDLEMNQFEKTDASTRTTCRISFNLSDQYPPYHFMDHIWISYDKARETLARLLCDTEFSNDEIGVGTGTHIASYFPKTAARSVSAETVNEFADTFLTAQAEAKRLFLDPYSDMAKAAHECTLFYTKWPRSMGPLGTAYCLIAFGIEHGDREKVQTGVDRILAKLDVAQTDRERNLALAVIKGAFRLGYADERG